VVAWHERAGVFGQLKVTVSQVTPLKTRNYTKEVHNITPKYTKLH